ncbi:helix-turn-helix domain-containing protein [Arthrobacter sp. TMN-37]
MTSIKSSVGFGERLSKYRKLAGLSAQQLSHRTGGEISRSVIANFESGRKTEVSVDQLIALSWALDINPVALAMPIQAPYKSLALAGDDGVLPTHQAVRWWLMDDPDRVYRRTEDDSPSMLVTQLMISNICLLDTLTDHLRLAKLLIEQRGGSPESDASVAEISQKIDDAKKKMKALGMDTQSPEGGK